MNKHERVHAVLRQRIIDGTYGPGYRLVIDSLAGEFGTSSLPVREAIRRLEAEGWVVYRPNAGAHVAPLDSRHWEDLMTTLGVLEGYATGLAAGHLRSEDFQRLRQLNRAMAKALEDLDVLAFSRLNAQFHFAVYDRCPNPYLVDLLRQTWDRLSALRQTVFLYIPHRLRDSLQEHAQLITLIKRGAPSNEIELFAREHKLRTMSTYLSMRKSTPVETEPAPNTDGKERRKSLASKMR